MNEYLIKSLLESLGVNEAMIQKLGDVLLKIDRIENIEKKVDDLIELLNKTRENHE